MRRGIFCILFLLNSLLLFSQAEPRVGLKAGYNLTQGNASGVDGVSYSGGGGFSVGIYRDFKLGDKLGLESGLIVDKYGTKYIILGGGIGFTNASDKFTYLTIPFILQVQPKGKVSINTGPQLGFLLSAKTESGSQEEDVKEYTKGSMFNWAIGLEVNTGSNMDLGFRYLIGLTDINDAKDIIDASYKLNTIQLYVGLRFDKSKSE